MRWTSIHRRILLVGYDVAFHKGVRYGSTIAAAGFDGLSF